METFRAMVVRTLARVGGVGLGLGFLTGLQASDTFSSSFNEPEASAWSANSGWISFSQNGEGVVVYERFLAGFAWDQNTGWINFGDGTPSNGFRYGNDRADDFGVNLEASGRLIGYAWSANTGWVTFEQTRGQPRLDYTTGRLTGYAWSQNVGWINLGQKFGTPTVVAIPLLDRDGDGLEDSAEHEHFGSLGVADATTDFDGDGVSDAEEITADSDPTDPASQLRVLRLFPQPDPDGKGDGSSAFLLEWTSSPRRRYTILESSELSTPFAAQAELAGAEGFTTSAEVEAPADAARHFWRVQVHRPFLTNSNNP